jgi:heme exporter protein A
MEARSGQARGKSGQSVPFAAVVSVTKLSKSFGLKRVLSKVDVELAVGGFLLVTGPNGSGKTTLLRVLAGLDAPTSGDVVLPDRAMIGYLGHEPLVYRELTPLENLHLFGRLYRVPDRAERIGMLLERFGLWEVRDEHVSTFSRGMRQRLGLCRVLLHRPELVVLDEPFNALDEAGSALLDATLAELAPASALIVATHDPVRVERLATQRLAFG